MAVCPRTDDETMLMSRGAKQLLADRAPELMFAEKEAPGRAPEMVFVEEEVPGRAPEMVSGRLLPTRGGLRTPFRTLRQAFATKPISGPKRKDCNGKIPVLVFYAEKSARKKLQDSFQSFIKSYFDACKAKLCTYKSTVNLTKRGKLAFFSPSTSRD